MMWALFALAKLTGYLEARVSVLIKRFLGSKCDLPLGGHLRGRPAFA
jgi:hypothetical protein